MNATVAVARWSRLTTQLAVLTPLVLLLFRVFVALAFWRAGVVKWDDPSGTAYLFNDEYHVPLLAPALAATLATWAELVLPVFVNKVVRFFMRRRVVVLGPVCPG